MHSHVQPRCPSSVLTRIFATGMIALCSGSISAQEWQLRQQLSPERLIQDRNSDFGRLSAALDGRHVVVGNHAEDRRAGAAYVFDILTGKQTHRLTAIDGRRNDWFGGIGIDVSEEMAVIPAGLSNTGSPSFYVFNIETGEQIAKHRPSDFDFSAFGIDYDLQAGNLLAFSSTFRAVPRLKLVDLSSREERFSYPRANHFALDGNSIIIADKAANSAILVDWQTEQELATFEPTGQVPTHHSVAISSDHVGLVSATDFEVIDVFARSSGELINTIETGLNISGEIAIDGNHAAVSFIRNISRDPRVDEVSASIYDITTGEEVFSFPWHEAGGASVDLDGNNAIFAVPTDDETGGTLYVATLTGLAGDFDANGFFNHLDVDSLSEQIRTVSFDPVYDLNSDGAIDELDRLAWVTEIARTHLGDTNLDGLVDFKDFVSLSSSYGKVGGWAEGDFDGSGDVTFSDFVLLSESFGQPRVSAAAVPEPANLTWCLIATALFIFHRRPRQCGLRLGKNGCKPE